MCPAIFFLNDDKYVSYSNTHGIKLTTLLKLNFYLHFLYTHLRLLLFHIFQMLFVKMMDRPQHCCQHQSPCPSHLTTDLPECIVATPQISFSTFFRMYCTVLHCTTLLSADRCTFLDLLCFSSKLCNTWYRIGPTLNDRFQYQYSLFKFIENSAKTKADVLRYLQIVSVNVAAVVQLSLPADFTLFKKRHL